MRETEQINEKFLEEYGSEDAVAQIHHGDSRLRDQLSAAATIMPKCISAPWTPTCGLRRRGLFACWSLDVARDEHHQPGLAP